MNDPKPAIGEDPDVDANMLLDALQKVFDVQTRPEIFKHYDLKITATNPDGFDLEYVFPSKFNRLSAREKAKHSKGDK